MISRTASYGVSAFFLLTSFLWASYSLADEYRCETLAPTPSGDPVVEIMRVMVEGKLSRVVEEGLLRPKFDTAVSISFFVCSNSDLGMSMLVERDPPAIYLSESLFNVLYALSRAYILGAYAYRDLEDADKFGLVSNLVLSLASVDDFRNINWNKSVDDLAERFYGVPEEQVARWTSDEKFADRQLTTISTGLYFFVFHEVCHLLLGHTKLDLNTPEGAAVSQARELEADRCAMDIVNRDELLAGDGSPVSFYGLSHAVVVQVLAEEAATRLGVPLSMTHPAPIERISSGLSIVSQHLLQVADRNKADLYQAVAEDQAAYITWLVQRLTSP